MTYFADTIAAMATAPGEAAIAVVRMSGPEALRIGREFLRGTAGRALPRFTPRRAHLCELLDADGAPVDSAVVTWFQAPGSYTGEDILEISVHGGFMASRTALEQCLRRGARPAQPGEFTLRAFLNGRLDLSQAEAVIDTVQAQTRAGLRLAHRQLTGSLANRVQEIRAKALGVLAQVEAAVDFPDDVEDPDRAALASEIEAASDLCRKLSAETRAGRIYRDGIRLVIMGRPNVGKSSLLNALLREERAIVTALPGTTRDLIEEPLSIGGVPVRAVDTAGLRETEDPIERIGVERARSSIEAADILLLTLDRSEEIQQDDWLALQQTFGARAVIVLNKCDLAGRWDAAWEARGLRIGDRLVEGSSWPTAPPVVNAAAAPGEGIDRVEAAILQTLFNGAVIAADSLDAGSLRHGLALEQAAESLDHARATALSAAPLDLISVDIRGALQAVGQITGETAGDDLLHEIFSRFCIGK
ncbi:MAG TPA: tRNA uridine-5-carboxymethylaminomethyl(34) synthesis GTPase MnmE [Armatimonadota bacterium]|nr:tRNA uridine-5-carboxymethylaminomethyl(34) synthesis GTPase MnmE [Armatimonadota bacterium]